VTVNTDRLMSSIESRVVSLIRTETGALKQQLNRLDLAIGALRSDVSGLKTAIDAIRGNLHITLAVINETLLCLESRSDV
jgi:hypothetical protein